jgi:hypothetical protein
MPWVREGECCRCGECCVGDPGREDMTRPAPVEGYCPLYRIVDGVGACSDRQHPYYLAGCNVWPSQPSHIADKPSCSYTFRWES